MGLAALTLGEMRYHAGDASGAIRDCNEAVRLIPVTSAHHSPALAALGYCLSRSDRPEDVTEAFEMVPGLERRFHGIKRKSQAEQGETAALQALCPTSVPATP